MGPTRPALCLALAVASLLLLGAARGSSVVAVPANATLTPAADDSSSSDSGHHTQISITGVDVGVALSPAPPADGGNASAPAPAAPSAPGLLGDLLHAAVGESNGTIAQVLDKALTKEFEQESQKAEEGKGKTFNETVASKEATVETVVRISAGSKQDKDDAPAPAAAGGAGGAASGAGATGAAAPAGAGGAKPGGGDAAGGGGAAAGGGKAPDAAEEQPRSIEKGVDRIIDSHDNEFVLSAPPKDQVATLTLDPLLIQDLTFLFASAAVMGLVFEAFKQPVINGYLVAGAIVGPGGLQLIKELVQVESLAQLGVQLLLFHLGRELSFSKLRAVWSVALLGGSLQIVAMSLLGGLIAAAVKSPVTQGIFVGALLSMSSTSVVVKCLETYRMNGTAFGQIAIGTLILQDCSVGIMFALMPAFGTAAASGAAAAAAAAAGEPAPSGGPEAMLSIATLVATVLMKLLLLVSAAYSIARIALPLLLRLLLRHASKELVQLSLVSLCLCSAWLCGGLGLSEELGAFVAGAMMAMAEQRLVASGHLVPSSPATPRKEHLSAPDSPGLSPTKHGSKPSSTRSENAAAIAYYRHATQARKQEQVAAAAAEQAALLQGGRDAEAGEAGGHALDAGALSAQLNALQAAQQATSRAGTPFPGAESDGGGGGGGGGLHSDLGGGGGPSPRSHLGGGGGHSASVCANIESIQNVLTALFVASMGLIMSPVFLWHHAAVLLSGTLVVTLLKAAVVTAVVRMFAVPLRLSLAVGLSMAHVGEFSFVLLSMANQLKLLSSQVYMLLLGMTAMSLLTTPLVIVSAIHLCLGGSDSRQPHLYIAGLSGHTRLRLSSDRGGPPSPGSADAVVLMGEGARDGVLNTAVARTARDHRPSGSRPGGGIAGAGRFSRDGLLS